jgi:uncharacterized membrane protein
MIIPFMMTLREYLLSYLPQNLRYILGTLIPETLGAETVYVVDIIGLVVYSLVILLLGLVIGRAGRKTVIIKEVT